MTRTYMIGERQAIIVLGGLIAGLGLYITTREKSGVDLDLVFATVIGLFYLGKTLMLTGHIDALKRVVALSFAVAVVFTLLAYQYAVHVGYDAELIAGSDAIPDFLIALHVAYFLIVTALQTWLERGRSLPYQRLFENAWNNLILSVFPFLFVGLFFGSLFLAHLLMSLVGVTFIEDLLEKEWFSIPLAGFLFALTIIYLRDHDKFMTLSRRFVLAMARIVGLVLCTAAVAFLLYLPIAGFDVFWSSKMAASVMLTVVIVTGIYANAYVADGVGESWRDVGLLRKWLVTVAVAALSLFAVLGLWAFKIRISDYGLTPDRVIALPVFGVALIGALGYLVQIIRFRQNWAQNVAGVNKTIALLIIVSALAIQIAPFSAYQIAADSQYRNIVTGAVEKPDFRALKYKMAAPGREHFTALADQKDMLEQHGYFEAYEKAESATSWWEASVEIQTVPMDKLNRAQLDAAFEIFNHGYAVPEVDMDQARKVLLRNKPECYVKKPQPDRGTPPDCLLLVADLNEDGAPEFIAFSESHNNPVLIAQKQPSPATENSVKWDIYSMEGRGNIYNKGALDSVRARLASGDFKVQTPRFNDLALENIWRVTGALPTDTIEFEEGEIVEKEQDED